MHSDLLYQLALASVPHIGPVQAKTLCDHFENARDIFSARQSTLESIDGIGKIRAKNIKGFNNFNKAEKEIRFIEQYEILPIFIKDNNYPQRLLHCYDPPILLFYRGIADLNATKILSIIGTRKNSEYGKDVLEKIIQYLSNYNVLIISGLAFGIDVLAHKTSIHYGLSTVGVLAHGLDTIYPSEHASLARKMTKCGGLLTEFFSTTKPDKHNFPSRNRIVAGISDATIIIESDEKGGSMITADIAGGYNKDVFAVPGRITECRSAGCNALIRDHKAIMLSHPQQIIENLQWEPIENSMNNTGPATITLSESEKQLLSFFNHSKEFSVEELMSNCSMKTNLLSSALTGLELKNIIKSLPGKRYRLSEEF